MKLNELLNIKYPIIQGGMANIATGAFAASVSNAGGLGLIGAGGMNAKMLKAEIQACKKLTNQPFGVNIMLLNPEAKEMAQCPSCDNWCWKSRCIYKNVERSRN